MKNSVGYIDGSDKFNIFPPFRLKNKYTNIAPTPAIIIFLFLSIFIPFLYLLNNCIYYEPRNC